MEYTDNMVEGIDLKRLEDYSNTFSTQKSSGHRRILSRKEPSKAIRYYSEKLEEFLRSQAKSNKEIDDAFQSMAEASVSADTVAEPLPEVPEVQTVYEPVAEAPVVPEVPEVQAVEEPVAEVPVVPEVPEVQTVEESVAEVPVVPEEEPLPEVPEVQTVEESVAEVPVVQAVEEPVAEVPEAQEAVDSKLQIISGFDHQYHRKALMPEGLLNGLILGSSQVDKPVSFNTNKNLTVEEPVAEAPVVPEEEPVAEVPEVQAVEEPLPEVPEVEAVEEPVVEAPVVPEEEPVAEVPEVETVEEPVVEAPVVPEEEPVAEVPEVEAVEEPVVEAPVVPEEEPVAEVPEAQEEEPVAEVPEAQEEEPVVGTLATDNQSRLGDILSKIKTAVQENEELKGKTEHLQERLKTLADTNDTLARKLDTSNSTAFELAKRVQIINGKAAQDKEASQRSLDEKDQKIDELKQNIALLSAKAEKTTALEQENDALKKQFKGIYDNLLVIAGEDKGHIKAA